MKHKLQQVPGIWRKSCSSRRLQVTGLIVIIIFLSQCMQPSVGPAEDLRGSAYAGSASCASCHADIYNSTIHTAHFNTSSDSLTRELKAGFDAGTNKFRYNDSVEVWMEREENRFVQTCVLNGRKLFSQPFDIIVGSGRKAQTFLYYNDQKKISQLPLSYLYSAHAWANSPGFPATDAKFDRNIPSYCLGCHSSYVAVKQTYTGVVLQEEFEKNKIVFGIDCERCHGPARVHVEFHTGHPGEKKAHNIASFSRLTRKQQNDQCALCHSGFRDVQQSLFYFKPGDDIDRFYIPEFGRIDTAGLDVHGNQYQLMTASKCFRESANLTCNSCHNVHQQERSNFELFSQRCRTCHQEVKHGFWGKETAIDKATEKDCISCHMPEKPSSLITLLTEGKKEAEPDPIRTHLITIYQTETRKLLDSLRRK